MKIRRWRVVVGVKQYEPDVVKKHFENGTFPKGLLKERYHLAVMYDGSMPESRHIFKFMAQAKARRLNAPMEPTWEAVVERNV